MDYSLEFIHFFLFSFLALFPIMNPIGMSPIFIHLTEQYSKTEKLLLAKKVAMNAVILLIVVLFIGSSILHLFGLSLNFIRIAGGLLVAWSAWDSLGSSSRNKNEDYKETTEISNLAFFPLTMPITAGPGSFAVTMALDTRIVDKISFLAVFQYLGIICGIVSVSLLVWVCYAFAENIFNRLGKTGAIAITKISAMIILAIGVQIFWQGFSPLLEELLSTVLRPLISSS